MEIEFSPTALKDLSIIKRSHSNTSKNRLTRILESIKETPFSGFASPEALKHELSGKWSRKLSKKDRVIYSIEGEIIKIHSLVKK
ncbi:MAG: Txe/YoeB family addiction module toxin [Paludibacter sp.]|nr:Txe/YoeB family addiction module toxin [Paludibacter sp.]